MPDAMTMHELQKSRRIVAYESAEFWYVITGTADEKAVLGKLKDTLAWTYKFLPDDKDSKDATLQPPEVEPVFINEEKPELCIWEVRVNYKYISTEFTYVPEEGDNTYQFDTTGGTQHITQSLRNIWKSPNAPDFKGGIGWDGENFQGVDIAAPVFKFSETHLIKNSKITEAYKKKVADLTGKVNLGAYKGREDGEVLFLGATGSMKNRRKKPAPDDLWEVTYTFAVSPNATNLTVGDINVPDKKGWDYLWVFYAPGVDTAAYRRVKTPKGVYVERVYNFVDMTDLIPPIV